MVAKSEPGGREPYGTGIRNAIARRDFDELRAHIGVVEMSLEELARREAKELAEVSGVRLDPEKSAELNSLLKKMRTLLQP